MNPIVAASLSLSMVALFRRIPKFCAYTLLVVALVVGFFVLGLRYWLLPNIEQYRSNIVASVSQVAGTRVEIGGIRADWSGFRPRLELDRVQVFDKQNNLALELIKVDTTLSWRTLLAGAPRLRSLEIIQPSLDIKRDKQGKWFVAGLPVSEKSEGGGISDLVLETGDVFIRGAILSWEDEFRGAPRLILDGVSLRLENRGARHRFGFIAKPPAELAGLIDLRGELRGTRLNNWQDWSGKLFAELPYADGNAWRSYVPLPKTFRGGRGAVRLWLDFHGPAVDSFIADVKLWDTVARLNENLPELDLAKLDGRIRYRTIGAGFEVASEKLSVVTRGETRTGATDFFFRTESKQGRKESHGEFRANHLELAAWASLITYLPLDASLKAKLAAFAPSGRVSNFAYTWVGEPDVPSKYSLVGQIEQGAINPVGTYPGGAGITARIDADETGGNIFVESLSQLNAPKVFRWPLPVDHINVQAKWRHDEGNTNIMLDEFTIDNAHLAASAKGLYRIAKDKSRFMDLNARIGRFEGRHLPLYLPSLIEPHALTWLDKAIVAAKVSEATLRVHGDLKHFPFVDEKNGQFMLRIGVSEGILAFAESWPRIENISGEVTLRARGLEVKARDGNIFGAKIKNVVATVADFHAPDAPLSINGEAIGPVVEKLRFINQSPVKDMLGGFTENTVGSGDGNLMLKLFIPLHDVHATRVNGDYLFKHANLDLGNGIPPISDINGHLQFSETMVRAQDIPAKIFGGPARINIATRQDGTVAVDANGSANIEAVRGMLGYSLLSRLSGQAEWQGRLALHKGSTTFSVTSPLVGVASDLPNPLSKTAAQEMPFIFERRFGAGKSEVFRVSLGDVVFGEFERIAPPGAAEPFIKRGMLSFGKPAGLPDKEGIWLGGSLQSLNIDRWREILKEEARQGHSVIAGVDVTLASIRAFDRRFTDLHFVAKATDGKWEGSLSGKEISGDFVWQPAGKGLLYARLKRLLIPDDNTGQPAQVDTSIGEIDFPALDIVAEELQVRSKKLGRLELKAEQQGKDWQISRLTLVQAGATLEAQGAWSRSVKSETVLKLKLESPDVGKLLGELGFPNSVLRGTADLSGELSWPGAPYEMIPAKLSGNLKLEAKRGQFLKVEPGAGRLLGLISLQSLPRRITLDFRDIFSEGFSFDEVGGDLDIRQGIMATKDFLVSGPAAKVEMSGDVNLGEETQQLKLKVIPTVGEGVSIATGLLGGPIVGVTTFILQKVLKDPISRAVAYEYNVTGTWDNPKVVKLEYKPINDDSKQQ